MTHISIQRIELMRKLAEVCSKLGAFENALMWAVKAYKNAKKAKGETQREKDVLYALKVLSKRDITEYST